MKLKSILCLVFLFVVWPLTAQKNITQQQLLWGVYNNILEFDSTWFLYTEAQERHFINPEKHHQTAIRTHLHRRITEHVDVAVGMCTFLQSPNDPHIPSNLVVPELRPHVEVNYKQHEGKLAIEQRLRFEWRYFHNNNGRELTEGYTFGNNRLRYQLVLLYPVWTFSNGRMIKLKIGDEIHLNLGKKIVNNMFDHNRYFVGINFPINQRLSIEPGYLNWFQQLPSGVDFYNRNVFRVSVYHTIKLGRK